jgi:hypothetical protein
MEPNLSTIRARRAELAKMLEALAEEARELDIAERVLTRLGATYSANGASGVPSVHVVASAATQQDIVISTLRLAVDPWFESPAALHAEIERTHGIRYKNSSFQPLLSHLKKKRIVARDGARIALAERVNQAPERIERVRLTEPSTS